MAIDYPYALSEQRYREVLASDFDRLRSLVDRARDQPVPDCPGWTGADAATHTALVYQHKVREMQTGEEVPFADPELTAMPPAEALDRTYAALVAEFDSREVDDPAHTWWPPDQTVGFWLRRMAQETGIHRLDVERAAGQPTPIAEDLAVDGIDEALDWFLGWDWEDEPAPGATGAAVRVESAGHVWVVRLDPRQAVLDRSGEAAADATVTGGPDEVLRWLWGRGPQPATTGSQTAVDELRQRLVLAMT